MLHSAVKPSADAAMEPVPLETLVDYHGSEVEGHGRYRVWRHDEPMPQPLLSDEELASHYPDGVAYSLWPEGIDRKFGMRHLVISNVRRSSLSVVG